MSGSKVTKKIFDIALKSFLTTIGEDWSTEELIKIYPDDFVACFESQTQRGWEHILEHESRLTNSGFLVMMCNEIFSCEGEYQLIFDITEIFDFNKRVNRDLFQDLFYLLHEDFLIEGHWWAELPFEDKWREEWFDPFNGEDLSYDVFGCIPFEALIRFGGGSGIYPFVHDEELCISIIMRANNMLGGFAGRDELC